MVLVDNLHGVVIEIELPRHCLQPQASTTLLGKVHRVIMPIHVGINHWACAEVDLQERMARYYDSLQVCTNRGYVTRLGNRFRPSCSTSKVTV